MRTEENQKIKNSRVISNCIGFDFYEYYELKLLFSEIFEVFNHKQQTNYFDGQISSLKYNSNNIEIKDVYENKTCTINTLEFAKLVLLWAEANYYLQKSLNKNWDVTMEWIEQQWKQIEKYEK
jgi:hypothetical protein